MAIDNAEKRKQVAGVSRWWNPCVTPNVAKDDQWRAQAGRSYSLLAGGPVGLGWLLNRFLLLLRRRRRLGKVGV